MATWRPLRSSQHAVRSPGRGRRSSAGPAHSCARAAAPAPRKRIGNIWRLRDCVNEAFLYEGNLWASETPKQRPASGSLEPSALAPNQAPSRLASPPPASGGAARPGPALCRRNSPCRPEAKRRVRGGSGALWSPLPPGGRSGSPGARLPLPRSPRAPVLRRVGRLSMGKSCKVVVCGQASVGKTSILEQLLYGNHVVGSEMMETQEDIYVGSIETDRGVREQVRFYDTRGLRDGTELPRHCFSCTDGYVLVYSTDSRESFQRVELLKKEIDKSKDKKEVTIVVLGNKCDLQEQRRVDPDVAQHWAKSEKVKLWEVSVADRRSLLEPFVYLASKMTQPQSKSAFPLSRKNKGSGSLDG